VMQEVVAPSSPSDKDSKEEQAELEEFEEPITGVALLIRPWLWCRKQPEAKPVKKKDTQEEEQKKSGDTGTTSVLQKKLNRLAVKIGYGGTIAAITCFLLLVIRFGIVEFGVDGREWDHNSDWEELLHFAIISITVLVVAVPEGLPLAVTIALAYSVQKMLKDNNLVRHLHACETMGNATTICSDKTGTLTLNRMTVVEVYLAGKVHKSGSDNASLMAQLPQILLDLLQHCIVLNCSYSSRVEEVSINFVCVCVYVVACMRACSLVCGVNAHVWCGQVWCIVCMYVYIVVVVLGIIQYMVTSLDYYVCIHYALLSAMFNLLHSSMNY